ncbi:tRNA (cytidine(34)-2'-O)-methyltransferase [Magnetococcales bacterium HHB-1]
MFDSQPGPCTTPAHADFHVILYQPEIPQNTGNILRLCAISGVVLHLIEPLGFRLDSAGVRRAGMDYRELALVYRWPSWSEYMAQHPEQSRIFVVTTQGEQNYGEPQYQPGDRFLFGSEGAGLPEEIHLSLPESRIRIPMLAHARSMNLAGSVSIVLYEALRQQGFSNLQ